MFWHIEKGDDLVRARPIELDFFRSFSPNPSRAQLQTTERLLQSDRDNAPRHQRPEMTTNCVLQADLSILPEEFLDKRFRTDANSKKVEYWDSWYKLVVTISRGYMQFSLKCREKSTALLRPATEPTTFWFNVSSNSMNYICNVLAHCKSSIRHMAIAEKTAVSIYIPRPLQKGLTSTVKQLIAAYIKGESGMGLSVEPDPFEAARQYLVQAHVFHRSGGACRFRLLCEDDSYRPA